MGIPSVDVVVVAYNSRAELRACVEPLAASPDVRVIVVDNASPDASLEAVADLTVETIALESNMGFAHGCNAGWRAGSAPFVLLLNPDTRVRPGALEHLVAAVVNEDAVGAAAPMVVDGAGALDYSQRRFPRLRSTFAQALFLHRLWPRATWVDEVVRDDAAYSAPSSPDWVSGACILVRRSVLDQLNGLDDGFFMYCEDIDLCLRIRHAGYDIRFVPEAVIEHDGGASAPRPSLLPVLAASRVRFAAKHRGRVGARLEQFGVALGALTHVIVSRGGREVRRGHVRALLQATSRS